MNNNKKDFIISAFQRMDLSMLEVLLDDNKTYQNTTKEVFIGKIEEVFLEFQANDDTHLLSYKGFCNSDKCSNKGCSGYSFIGNTSKKKISLIFGETEDDFNDIYDCLNFKTVDETSSEGSLSIIIYEDEKVDFYPSFDFLIESEKCKLAYEELIQYKNKVIDKEVYLVWLEKHYSLYKSFFLPPLIYSDLYKFYKLYYKINELNIFLQSSDSAKEAIKEFQTIDKNNEIQLLKWLVKYEKTGNNNLTLFLYEDIDFEYPEKSEYFEVADLKINTSDFKYIAKFKFLFDEYYWNMLDKYTTFKKGYVYNFEQEFIQFVKEKHILDSEQKYQNYLQEYEKYPRGEEMIESEGKFVKYLNDFDNYNRFLHDYLWKYCKEEFYEYEKKSKEISHNYTSLAYHLDKRGIVPLPKPIIPFETDNTDESEVPF